MLHAAMLRACDDFVLHGFSQLDEAGAVAGNANNQIL